MSVAAVNADFALPGAIFTEPDGELALLAFQPAMQHKGGLIVPNYPSRLQTAKRTSVAQRIDRLKHAGFAATVRAHQKIKSRR